MWLTSMYNMTDLRNAVPICPGVWRRPVSCLPRADMLAPSIGRLHARLCGGLVRAGEGEIQKLAISVRGQSDSTRLVGLLLATVRTERASLAMTGTPTSWCPSRSASKSPQLGRGFYQGRRGSGPAELEVLGASRAALRLAGYGLRTPKTQVSGMDVAGAWRRSARTTGPTH
jgi:hypothetical protein